MSFPAQTTLQTAISSGATTVTPVSAAGLTAPCYLVIEEEIVYCPTSLSGGSFTGVIRGALSTDAAAHAQYVAVYGLFSDLFPFTSSDGEFLNAIAAELNTVERRIATGGNTLPQVVSTVNFTAQSGSLNFSLMASPATGDYVLNDYLTVTAPDSAATIDWHVTYADESGPVDMSNIYGPTSTVLGIVGGCDGIGSISIQGNILAYSDSIATAGGQLLPPAVIHAVSGTPIQVVITVGGATTLRYSYHATLVQNQ